MTRITNSNPLSLENVGHGEVLERFNKAVVLALQNIKDASTPAQKPRKIIIEAVIKPSPDRDGGDLSVSVTTKFPASDPYSSQLIISQRIDGDFEAHESVSDNRAAEDKLINEI